MQKAPACTIKTLSLALTELLGNPAQKIKTIGTRHGEKLYEVLLSREEIASARDFGDYYCVPPDMRDLNYNKYVEIGEHKITESQDYNSNNTHQLNVDEMKTLLLSFPNF